MSDPYARYKAQLASYRRDSPTKINGVSKTFLAASTPTTTVGTTYSNQPPVTSSTVAVRQPSSNITSPAVSTQQFTSSPQGVTSSSVLPRPPIPSVTSPSVTSQQTSISAPGVISSNADPKLSTPTATSSKSSPQPSAPSVPTISTSSEAVAQLSTQTTISTNIAQRQVLFSTPGVASTSVTQRPSVPWRRTQQPQPSSIANDEGNVTRPENTASMIRRSVHVLTYLITCCWHAVVGHDSSVNDVYPCMSAQLLFTLSPIHRGTGYCFRSISLFVCLYLSLFIFLSLFLC